MDQWQDYQCWSQERRPQLTTLSLMALGSERVIYQPELHLPSLKMSFL